MRHPILRRRSEQAAGRMASFMVLHNEPSTHADRVAVREPFELVVGVAGAPGVGKTSVLRGLSASLGIRALLEDPELFPLVHHVGGRSADWHFLNQLGFQIRKIESLALFDPARGAGLLIEFDWFSSHVYWTRALEENGMLTPQHVNLLDQVLATAVAAGVRQPDVFLELVAEPATVESRLHARDRNYEQTADMFALTRSLAQVRLPAGPVPVLQVVAEGPVNDVVEACLSALRVFEKSR